METRWALAIAGAAGVALFFVSRRTVTPAAPAVPQSVNPNANRPGDSIGGLVSQVGGAVGNAVGGAVGAGPAGRVFGAAGANFASAEYGAWKQAGTGFVNIAKGNVISGTKDVVVGGVKTAIAPVTGVYNTIKGWL